MNDYTPAPLSTEIVVVLDPPRAGRAWTGQVWLAGSHLLASAVGDDPDAARAAVLVAFVERFGPALMTAETVLRAMEVG